MPMHRSAKALVLALPLVALSAACTTQGAHGNDHWSQRSVSNSLGRSFLGYEAYRDGDYIEFQHQNKRDVGLVIRRYLFHHNPYNPFQGYDATYFRPRYPHSILPDTVSYLQDPIASVIGTFSERGDEEMAEGLRYGIDTPEGATDDWRTASYLRKSMGVETQPE
jgi:hypothetical protein